MMALVKVMLDQAAEKIGMYSENRTFGRNSDQEEVLNELNRLNNDDSVSGILVQVPLPKQVSEQKILEAINPEKDVDGFSSNKLYIDEQTFVILHTARHHGNIKTC